MKRLALALVGGAWLALHRLGRTYGSTRPNGGTRCR